MLVAKEICSLESMLSMATFTEVEYLVHKLHVNMMQVADDCYLPTRVVMEQATIKRAIELILVYGRNTYQELNRLLADTIITQVATYRQPGNPHFPSIRREKFTYAKINFLFDTVLRNCKLEAERRLEYRNLFILYQELFESTGRNLNLIVDDLPRLSNGTGQLDINNRRSMELFVDACSFPLDQETEDLFDELIFHPNSHTNITPCSACHLDRYPLIVTPDQEFLASPQLLIDSVVNLILNEISP